MQTYPDGLRAIAVLSVVIYHAFKNTLKGGFVGVDIFFVISGFLITGILIKSLDNQAVTGGGKTNLSILLHRLISFYARRVRRIFPVLIVVLLSCIFAGWLIMSPDEYRLLGKHIAGGSVYISNFILWFEAGYFDVSSETKPLLHLWSLGIEEQFYIVWPFVILILLKLKLRLETFLFLFFLGSFGLNAYRAFITTGALNGTFYAPPTRFWELAVGGVLSAVLYRADPIWNKLAFFIGKNLNTLIYSENKSGREIQTFNDVISVLGIGLLAFSVIVFNSGMIFPGSKALLPTLGTAMVIAAGPEAFVNRKFLSIKLMVFIGLISYPLYLWHWPLLSFARIFYGELPPRLIRIALVVIAMLLAWLTYRFIEPPLRWGKHSRIKAVCLFLTLLFVGFCGIKIYNNHGYPERIGITAENIQRDIELDKIMKESSMRCNAVLPNYESNSSKEECVFQKDNHKNTIALFGDSHSRYLSYGLIDLLRTQYPEEGLVRFSVSATAPFLNFKKRASGTYKTNGHLAHLDGYNYVFADNNIKTVIIATYPHVWYDITRNTSIPYYNKMEGYIGMEDVLDPEERDESVLLERALKRTFDALKEHNKKVIFVVDNPDFFYEPSICAVRPYQKFIHYKFDDRCFPKRVELAKNPNKVWFNSILEKVSKDYDNITLVNAFDSLCDKETCPLTRNGILLYRDDDHVSNEGARLIAKDILNVIFK